MRRIWLFAAAAAACGSGVVAGCGHAPSGPVSCGSTRTAADVPVVVEVAKGGTSCQTAMRIEASYAAMVKSGAVRGNGGGAPVSVGNGWTCQGYDTPKILSTGDASECHNGAAELLAVLPASTPSPH